MTDVFEFATGDIVGSIAAASDKTILLYPVVADSISALPANSETDVSAVAFIEERPVLNDEGAIDIDNIQEVMVLDVAGFLALGSGISISDLGESSITVDGVPFDILRKVADDGGQLDCYLQRVAP